MTHASAASVHPRRRSVQSPAVAGTIVVLVLAGLGFFPTYFGLFPGFPGVAPAIHFHAATLIAWLVLVLVQAVLVRKGRTDLHKRLGQIAFALLPLVILGFVLAMNDGQRRHKNPELILATLFDASLFLFFVGLGLWHRRKPALHRAFMLLALLPFLNPALGRLVSPMLSLPIELLAMVALLLLARRRKEPLRPYVVGLGLFFVSLGLLVSVMVARPEIPERLWQGLYGS